MWFGEKNAPLPTGVITTSEGLELEVVTSYSGAKKVFSQPPIVQVLPLKNMREACNFHHRYTSTMTDKVRKKIQKITL